MPLPVTQTHYNLLYVVWFVFFDGLHIAAIVVWGSVWAIERSNVMSLLLRLIRPVCIFAVCRL